MIMKHVASDLRLPSGDETIGPGTILDGQGRLVRVVPAEELRRRHPLPLNGRRDLRRTPPGGNAGAMRRVAALVVAGPLLMFASAWAAQAPPVRTSVFSPPLQRTTTEADHRL